MKCRVLAVLVLMFALSPWALAQDYKMELSAFFGYTLSEGINFGPDNISGGLLIDKITPKSAPGWGFQADLLAAEMNAFGFQFSEQWSKMELSAADGQKVEITDTSVRNYHGMFTFNFGAPNDTFRPFLFIGLGMTQYSPSDIQGNSVDSKSKFSTTGGGGLKLFQNKHLGIRLSARWTPTFIRSDPSGFWCSPYWIGGVCWISTEPNYSHQVEMTGGGDSSLLVNLHITDGQQQLVFSQVIVPAHGIG
jgi:opacity protein-like surface antigen